VADAAESVVREAGPASPRPVATAAEEVLVPGKPATAPPEHVTPEAMTRAASPEIQEAEEDTGTDLLQEAASGKAQTLELACTSWAAAFESSDDTEDDKEVMACSTLECGLEWARHAFDELILPATSVSFSLETCFFGSLSSFEKCDLFLSCSGQTLVASGRSQACVTRELYAERAQLEMQLVVARVVAATAVASEVSARTSLEAA
jgi:hypothetical protein